MIEQLVILLPFISFVLSGIFCIKPSKGISISSAILIVASSVLAWFVFYEVVADKQIKHHLISTWIVLSESTTHWAIYIDSTVATMLAVVTTVSALVHVYSIGYMEHDGNPLKFMAFISLFTFFMLLLVTSDNLLQLFFGWEGVGVCSYLLIGYWYDRDSACNAAIKAFLVNRIADVCFIIGIFAIYTVCGSLNFAEIFQQMPRHTQDVITILGCNIRQIDFICMMLFIGCMGKSAQILFHTWLPDAMEGPTPVSALIHAATMVTAGVFLVVRCSPLFELSQFTLDFITIVGSVTCLITATMALVENDIKRIIAFSTCSQLGYMFIACGLSAYGAAMFHLTTHAFFKALLFLGAGSVIHAMNGEQDIRRMGNIFRQMPFTYAMMLIGSLAASGIFPFAGYFSKDAIIEAAYARHSAVGNYAYLLAIITACCTAFYSFRLLILTFHGQNKTKHKAHEPPLTFLVPLGVLSIGAIFAGLVGKSFFTLPHADSSLVKIFASGSAITGILFAILFYVYNPNLPKILQSKLNFIYDIFARKYYINELYDLVLVQPVKKAALYLREQVEMRIIDHYAVNGLTSKTNEAAGFSSKLQSGLVYNYALVMLVAIICVIGWCFV